MRLRIHSSGNKQRDISFRKKKKRTQKRRLKTERGGGFLAIRYIKRRPAWSGELEGTGKAETLVKKGKLTAYGKGLKEDAD